jgi:hypothetical protein
MTPAQNRRRREIHSSPIPSLSPGGCPINRSKIYTGIGRRDGDRVRGVRNGKGGPAVDDAAKATTQAAADSARTTADVARTGVSAISKPIKTFELPNGVKIEAPDGGFVATLEKAIARRGQSWPIKQASPQTSGRRSCRAL